MTKSILFGALVVVDVVCMLSSLKPSAVHGYPEGNLVYYVHNCCNGLVACNPPPWFIITISVIVTIIIIVTINIITNALARSGGWVTCNPPPMSPMPLIQPCLNPHSSRQSTMRMRMIVKKMTLKIDLTQREAGIVWSTTVLVPSCQSEQLKKKPPHVCVWSYWIVCFSGSVALAMFTTNCTKPLDLLPVNGQNWPNLYFYSPILIAAGISLLKKTPTKGSITETSIPTNQPWDPARPSYLRLFVLLFGVGLPHRRDDISYFTAHCTDVALHKTYLAKILTSGFIYLYYEGVECLGFEPIDRHCQKR